MSHIKMIGAEEQELLMGIPDEMWEHILTGTRMNKSDMTNFRSVNKKCNTLADNLWHHWIIKIDDRFEHAKLRGPYLETLLNRRVKELKIVHLLDPLPFRPPGVILKYPDMLKIIRIKSDYQTEMGISAENLHVLLKSRNLEKVYLELADGNINSLVYSSEPPLIGYDFSKVKMLSIIICNAVEKQLLEFIEGNLLQRILKCSIFSNLNYLDIKFQFFRAWNESAVSVYQISCEVLEFIVKYGDTLQSVKSIINGGGGRGEFPIYLKSVEVSLLQNCSKLNSLNVCGDFLHGTWRILLGLQKKLVDLRFSTVFIPMSLFRTVVDKNCNTLTCIDLDYLKVDEVLVEDVTVRLFDFVLFSNCSNLRKLRIDFYDTVVGKNLSVLHEKIELLKLENILCPSEELFLFSFNRVQLRILSLIACGRMGRFGINWSVLENLRALSKISEVQISWNSINMSISAEFNERETRFKNLGDLLYNHGIFLKRDISTALWREM